MRPNHCRKDAQNNFYIAKRGSLLENALAEVLNENRTETAASAGVGCL